MRTTTLKWMWLAIALCAAMSMQACNRDTGTERWPDAYPPEAEIDRNYPDPPPDAGDGMGDGDSGDGDGGDGDAGDGDAGDGDAAMGDGDAGMDDDAGQE